MNIRTVVRPQTLLVGLEVVAHWRDLPREVPLAWERLFACERAIAAAGEIETFVELSLGATDGIYTEILAAQVHALAFVPEGLIRIDLPENRYLHRPHEGPLEEIAAGFGALLEYARREEISVSDVKLDTGYARGLTAGRHDLHVGLAPFGAPQITRG